MREWFRKFSEKYRDFMYGRYGADELGRTLLISALVCVILSYLPYLRILSLAATVLLLWYFFRVFSKNYPARRNELNKYYVFKDKIKKKQRLWSVRWRDRKTHVYFKCKNCGAMIRVPKNKGEIEVTCPRCRWRTDKKT